VTVTCQSAEETTRTIVERVGPEAVLGLPIGIGKATHLADAIRTGSLPANVRVQEFYLR
jgi:hypothetical protein